MQKFYSIHASLNWYTDIIIVISISIIIIIIIIVLLQ